MFRLFKVFTPGRWHTGTIVGSKRPWPVFKMWGWWWQAIGGIAVRKPFFALLLPELAQGGGVFCRKGFTLSFFPDNFFNAVGRRGKVVVLTALLHFLLPSGAVFGGRNGWVTQFLLGWQQRQGIGFAGSIGLLRGRFFKGLTHKPPVKRRQCALFLAFLHYFSPGFNAVKLFAV